MSDSSSKPSPRSDRRARLSTFGSPVVDGARQAGSALELPRGRILLPDVFGFCRGVERALDMLDAAVRSRRSQGRKLFLLGQIIHNPWVNDYFEQQGVRILSPSQRDHPEDFIAADDCAIVPAFGVPLEIQRRLESIGCEIVDTTCGDVLTLWKWAEHAVGDGYGVFVFGRAMHDETVVTKSRLAAAGGKYVVAGNLDEVREFCRMVADDCSPDEFASRFGPDATNAQSLEPMLRLAQVSQTTMLYDETMEVRRIIQEAFEQRFGAEQAQGRLRFQPTVCRATQARQSAAVELCRQGCDLAIVVGGFGSSNTHHLYELAGDFVPAYFIESAEAILSQAELTTYDFQADRQVVARDWLPQTRPLRIAVLAGASSPEIVVGQVIEKLAKFLQ